MAKENKQTTFTIEERLEQALVSDWEQPYKVPENWVWTKLGSVLTEIKNGTTVKQDKSGEGYSVTRIESLQHNTINFDRLGTIIDESQIKETDWYASGDVALSHINSAEHVGKTALISEDMLPLVHGMNLLRLRFNKACLPILFQYYSQSFQYKTEIISRINMAVNQVSINQKQLGMLEIPLPPLAEQQRIVDRIESLFSKLEEAKEKVQAALDRFEIRKAAILHKAFTGKLTAQWRKKHGVGMESWKNTLFDNCVDKMQNGLAKRRGSKGENTVVLRLANLSDDNFIEDDLRSIMLDDKEQKAYTLNFDDVLMIRVNGSKDNVGRQIRVNNHYGWAFCDHLIRIKYLTSLVHPQYMVYFASTDNYRKYIQDNMVSSAGQNTISRKGMANLSVPIALLPEQQEIVRILDDLFAKEQQAKNACADMLDRINLIKKSILARAFRCELGTNDPNEESALELLKQCLSQQAN